MASKKRSRRHIHHAPRRRTSLLTVVITLTIVLVVVVLLLLFLTSPVGKAGAELGPPSIGPDNPPSQSAVNILPMIVPDVAPGSPPVDRPPK